MFRRRSDAATEPAPQGTGASGSGATAASGKGRPTPKRREAEQARKKRVAPPKDRREAVARQRQRAREERKRARKAMVEGDPRHLPARDQGPVRAFCRDFVDSRRSVAEFLLPVLLVVLVLGMVPGVNQETSWVFPVMMLMVIVDGWVLARRLRRELKARFPKESHKGAVLYAVLRSTQLRRLRLPKPRVPVGAKV